MLLGTSHLTPGKSVVKPLCPFGMGGLYGMGGRWGGARRETDVYTGQLGDTRGSQWASVDWGSYLNTS